MLLHREVIWTCSNTRAPGRDSQACNKWPGPGPGCACTNGYVHYSCGTDYLRAKPERSNLVCEVCLADMTHMEVRFQALDCD